MNKPACPVCRTPKHVRVLAELCFCSNCKGTFDPNPDEGGDYSDRNPAARLEREDRERERRRASVTKGGRR